jgi:enterochelin esterase-like enzyme/predicted esterase
MALAFAVLSVAGGLATATIAAAGSGAPRAGRVVELQAQASSLAGNLLGEDTQRRVLVYLPPSYDSAPDRRYPVLYLLHAFGVGPESWRGERGYEGMDIAEVLDRTIAGGAVAEMLVVMPDAGTRYGGSWYASSPTIGDWERFIGIELVDEVDELFRTHPHRDARAIAGQSMGGYGALRIASAHAERFATAIALSAPHLVNPNPLGRPALEAALEVPSPDAVLAGSPLPAVIWSKAAAFSAAPERPPFYAELPLVRAGDELRIEPSIWERWKRHTIAGLLADPARRAALARVDLRLDVGLEDPLRTETRQLAQALRDLSLPYVTTEFEGGHVAGVREHFTSSVLPHLSRRFAGKVAPADSAPAALEPADAKEPPEVPTPETVPQALRPFAPLVGKLWVAALPSGSLSDEQQFEWVYGGRFLRNEHWVRNAAGEVVYEGETLYAWDPLSEQIVWWYWNATGGYVDGTMSESQGALVFAGRNHAPDGQTPRVRGALRDVSATGWESVQFLDRDGEWVERWTIPYRPKGDSSTGTASEDPKGRGIRDIAAMPVVYSLPEMDDVTRRSDLRYTSVDDPVLLMDVYLPPNVARDERLPGVVFIHGNVPPGSPAKNMGVLTSWGRLAAASGMVGITFTHRLGYPEPRRREAAADVADAIEFVRENADALHLDGERLCLVAFSGGGPLLSEAMRDRPEFVRCLVGFYALLDLEQSGLHGALEAPQTLRAFSPVNHLSQDVAPMFVARAGLDGIPGINDSIDRFARVALTQNSPITIVNHPRGEHGFDTQTDDEGSREIIRSALTFMRAHLGLTRSDE